MIDSQMCQVECYTEAAAWDWVRKMYALGWRLVGIGHSDGVWRPCLRR